MIVFVERKDFLSKLFYYGHSMEKKYMSSAIYTPLDRFSTIWLTLTQEVDLANGVRTSIPKDRINFG